MEDDQDESGTANLRHRSPAFNKDETKVLLDLINEFKMIILNKSNTGSVCRAKELTWAKIATKFNSHGFRHTRTIDGLRYKWKNLINHVRRSSKNLLDVNHDECDEFTSQILNLIYNEEINNSEIVLPHNFEEELEDIKQKQVIIQEKDNWLDNHEPEDSSGDDRVARNRSMNFTPQECKLLLQCVRAEKKFVFYKGNTTKALNIKKCAWSRITEEFNKQSPQKRSKKVLHTKFFNMKRMAKKADLKRFFKKKCNKDPKHLKLFEENGSKEIKSEPVFHVDDEPLNDNDDKIDSDDNFEGDGGEIDHELDRVHKVDPDPLSTVLNGDSGLGSSVHIDSFNPFENNEVVKMKMELLKLKIENAKLEKKRMERAIQEETKAQELSAIERALRLRAARLDTIAAEKRFPPSHPALLYTAEEVAAQTYLKQYQT